MYALILTIILAGNGSARSSATMTTVDGFASQQACLNAANLWLRENNYQPMYSNARYRAICVSTK